MINFLNLNKTYSNVELIKKLSQEMPSRNFISLTSQIEEMAKCESSSKIAKKLDLMA